MQRIGLRIVHGDSIQHLAVFHDRPIERSSVIRDKHIALFHLFPQKLQHRSFLCRITDQHLIDNKCRGREIAHADHKWDVARPHAKTGRFRIEK